MFWNATAPSVSSPKMTCVAALLTGTTPPQLAALLQLTSPLLSPFHVKSAARAGGASAAREFRAAAAAARSRTRQFIRARRACERRSSETHDIEPSSDAAAT